MKNDTNIVMLHHLLDYDSCRLVSAEVQLKNSLSGWINQAGSMQIKSALMEYLNITQQNLKKIKDFLEDQNIAELSLSNPVMRTFIDEANEKLLNCSYAEIRDICLLTNIQTINQFKISAYKNAMKFAEALEMERAANFFYEMEESERSIDHMLSKLAKYEINNRFNNSADQMY